MNAFIDGILSRLQEELDLARLGAGLATLITNIVVGVLIFATFFLVWRGLDWGLSVGLQKTRVDLTSRRFLRMMLRYTLLTIGTIQALAAMGVNTAAVLASLGIAGLTVGFAARDALSNFISGLLIYWDRPFVIGDLVEVDGNYGRVETITLRSTRIVTVDGRMLAVPNSQIINSTVASYTNFPNLRLDVDITIAVTEDIDRVRAILLHQVGQDATFLTTPSPQVVVTALNDYNVALQLQVWLDDERQHIAQRFRLRETLFKALSQAGVDMPYETLQLAPIRVQNSA